MYGGLGGGDVTSAATGAVSTVGGIVALPNTGGNPILIALSIATIVAGVAILGSFSFTRIASKLYR
jgi:hypothetical protein